MIDIITHLGVDICHDNDERIVVHGSKKTSLTIRENRIFKILFDAFGKSVLRTKVHANINALEKRKVSISTIQDAIGLLRKKLKLIDLYIPYADMSQWELTTIPTNCSRPPMKEVQPDLRLPKAVEIAKFSLKDLLSHETVHGARI